MLTVLETLFSLFFELIGGIFKVIFNIPSKRKTELNADFLRVSELLSRHNKGFTLNGSMSLTTKQSYMSALVLGGSGSGKTVKVCIPSIYNLAKYGHSLCIHDPSGELYKATGGYLNHLGYNIKVIHYSNLSISDGFNPLARAETASDIQKMVSLLVRNALGENNKDPFWQTQVILLLTLIIKVLQCQDKKYFNLANVKYLLDTMTVKPESMDILVALCNDQLILNEYKQFVVMDKKLLTSIISTGRAALAIINDPDIQKVTAYDSIDFEAFRKEKTVLYILNKTADIKYYSTLSAIFFEQLFGFLMGKLPLETDRSVFFLLDEASSLYLPSMQIALANLRKFRSGIMSIGQDFNQFIHLYGSYEAEAIRANSFAKVYFPGQPIETCQNLERVLGNFEYLDEKEHVRVRPLMTADEIRSMESNTALIVAGSHRAVHTKMKPYYKNWNYSSLPKYQLPERTNILPVIGLPLLPLPNKIK
jgi:type IV secretion system protein VirD4